MKNKITALLFVLLLSALAGCDAGMPVISIESAEGRMSPMMAGVASLFMKIVNSGNGDDVLIGASVDIPDAITELHDVKHGRMAKVESIPVPSHSVTILRPGSLHIMIFKMPKDVKGDRQFTLHLNFRKSGLKTVLINISATAASSKPKPGI